MDEKIPYRLERKSHKDYNGCYDCIHNEDSESMCIARLCIHAIDCLYDCYESKTEHFKREYGIMLQDIVDGMTDFKINGKNVTKREYEDYLCRIINR